MDEKSGRSAETDSGVNPDANGPAAEAREFQHRGAPEQDTCDNIGQRTISGIGEQNNSGTIICKDSPRQRRNAEGTRKLSAREVLNRIGENFVRTVDKNRGKAYAKLRSELMENIGVLVPDACSIEQLLGKVIDIENFVKGDTSEMVESPQEALAKWLKEDTAPLQ